MFSQSYKVDELGELKEESNMNQYVKRKFTEQAWSKIPRNPKKIKNKKITSVWKPHYEKDKKKYILKLYQKLFFK